MIRRVAERAQPSRDGVADGARPTLGKDVAQRVHPHALRHAYVTIALEEGARLHDVQADVGHASIATTQLYNHSRRITAADLVSDAVAAAAHPDTDLSADAVDATRGDAARGDAARGPGDAAAPR